MSGPTEVEGRDVERRFLDAGTSANLAALDALDARFAVIGRVRRRTGGAAAGGAPAVVVVRGGDVVDITARYPTTADLLDEDDPATAAHRASGAPIGRVGDVLRASTWEHEDAPADGPALTSPIDVQVIKACGVTFVTSMLERLIEEQAHGDRVREREFRREIEEVIGDELGAIRPGTVAAQRVAERLKARGLWSQYLEVGIGPHVEVFTKAPVLSSMGYGTELGLSPWSDWSTTEPELVLVGDARGRLVGVTLGNDVTLRDWEGRSALLLGRAKDYRRSCAVGPWVVVADPADTESLVESVMADSVEVEIGGRDGFKELHATRLEELSRPVAELVGQAAGPLHDYPDGFALFLGTVFAPTADRDGNGLPFSHHPHDVVAIRHPAIGVLLNRFRLATELPAWNDGIRALCRGLVDRGRADEAPTTRGR